MTRPPAIEMVGLSLIRPPHGVRRIAWRNRLYGSMGFHGWKGRPILAFKSERRLKQPYIAATGSHRIAAALQRGLSAIPVLVAPWSFERCRSTDDNFMRGGSNYDDLLSTLTRFNDIEPVWQDVIALLREDM